MKNFKISICTILSVLILVFPQLSFAVEKDGDIRRNPSLQGLDITAENAQIKTISGADTAQDGINQIIGSIVNVILSFTGIIFLIIIIAAGELWLTAGGNEEQTTKARGLITNGVIGIVVVFSAYVITNFIIPQILKVTGLS